MQDMRQLESMGLMDPEEVEKFQGAIDNSSPGDEMKNIAKLLDSNRAMALNPSGHIPGYRKEPLPKNKLKRQRANEIRYKGETAKLSE